MILAAVPRRAAALKLRCDTDEVSGDQRQTIRLVAQGAVAAPLVFYVLWVRPRLLSWGATRDETTRTYPGDGVVPHPDAGATMATVLPAPPERVWAWLAQMGGGRGGWYSWDWVDNNGQPSAARIVPEWQSLQVGQRLDSVPKGMNWFTVVVLEPNRTLVLRASYGLFTGRAFDPSPVRFRGPTWTESGASICGPPPTPERVWWSARGAGAAPNRWPGRSACWWANRCISSSRPSSSTTCARGWRRRRPLMRLKV